MKPIITKPRAVRAATFVNSGGGGGGPGRSRSCAAAAALRDSPRDCSTEATGPPAAAPREALWGASRTEGRGAAAEGSDPAAEGARAPVSDEP